MPTDEKMLKFEQIASKRTEKVLHDLTLLSNLANRNSYHYTEAHVQQMFGAIDETLASVKQAFEPPKASKPAFSFQGLSHVVSDEDYAREEEEDAELADEADETEESDAPDEV